MIPAGPIYNPLVLGREETLQTYVARIPLLERMVEDLRAERPANKLILGQRGMGKTTLLHRLRFAIEDDPELKGRWLALAFPEEQYDAARLSDFYLNCLDALGDSLDRWGDGDGASRLDARIQQLAGMPENNLAGKALAVLLEEAARAGKGLVLLVDNADRILEGISSQEQWSFRNLLEQDRRLMLIGAATQPMSCCYDYGKAFYDFFLVQDLAPLSEDEAREMLLRLGGRHQLEDRIRGWIDEDRARLRTLVTLTGGNPRTVAMLFGLLAQGTDGDVRSELERLLDLATPLFKARLEEMPRQAQQIVDALAQHWHPITAAALSELVRLEQGIVSSQLSRLARQGIVEKVPYFPDTKLAFQIAERFFNIWYLMRSSRRARTRLRWLVHFLRLFYSQPELERDAGQHLRRLRSAGSSERAAEWAFALGEAVDKRPLRAALESVAIRSLLERGGGRADFSEPFEAGGQDASLLSLADRTCMLEETRKTVLKARLPDPARNAGEFWDLLGGSLVLTVAEKRRLGCGIERLSRAQFTELVTNLEQDREELRTGCPELADALMEAIRTGVAANWDDVEGLLAAKEALDAPQLDRLANPDRSLVRFLERHRQVDCWVDRTSAASSCNSLGVLLRVELERDAEAEKAFRKATELSPEHVTSWGNLGLVLLQPFKRYEEAETALRRAIAIDAELPDLWNGLGVVLLDRRQYGEAEVCFRKAVELDARSHYGWLNLGRLYSSHLRRYAEAEHAYRKAVEVRDDAWNEFGNVLSELGKYQETELAYKRALQADPNDSHAWANLGRVQGEHLHQHQPALESYETSIALNPRNDHILRNFGQFLHLHLARYEDAVKRYREAIDVNPTNWQNWNCLGAVLEDHLFDSTQAEAAFRKALELKPDSKEALYNLGRCLEECGDVEGARSHYERAMQLDSRLAHPWVGMGDLHARDRRYAEAESSFRKAIELDSNYMSAWASLGWLLMHLGRLQEAESSFRRALEIEPAHFACALYLASCLAKQNKTIEAVESLKRLIKDARPALVDQVWDLILDFSREMVRHGKAKECLRLLDESELSERWVPLREAMAAVVAGSADYLRRIAPEARGPAEQILEKIDPSLPRKASRWVRSMLGGDE